MLTRGNKKLDRSVGIFSLPAVQTCPNCKDCEASCYAKAEEDRWKSCYNLRQQNLALSHTLEFVNLMVNEIIAKRFSIIRIHESGDFYNLEYLTKWFKIARALPGVRFYGYSKCFDRFPNALKVFNSLPNVNIINSITPLGKNYGDQEYISALRQDGYALCPLQLTDPAEGKKCMRDCKLCLTAKKVCFIAHGSKKRKA